MKVGRLISTKKIIVAVLMVLLLVGLFVTSGTANVRLQESYAFPLKPDTSEDTLIDNSVNIATSNAQMGLISHAEDDSVFDNGDTWHFTAVPNDGYVFTNWTFPAHSQLSEADCSGDTITIPFEKFLGAATHAIANFTAVRQIDSASSHLQYEVTFEKGDHGSLDGQTVYTHVLENADFPTAPKIIVDDGYAFTGWSPALPDSVTETQTYTAQYTKLQNNVQENEGQTALELYVTPQAATLTVQSNISEAGAFAYAVNDDNTHSKGPFLYTHTITHEDFEADIPSETLQIGDVVRIYPYAFPGFDYKYDQDLYVDVPITELYQTVIIEYETIPDRVYDLGQNGNVSFPIYCANGHLLRQDIGYYGDSLDGAIDITNASVDPNDIGPNGNVEIALLTHVYDGDSNISGNQLRRLAIAVYKNDSFIGFVNMTNGTIVRTDPRGNNSYLFDQSTSQNPKNISVVYQYDQNDGNVELTFEFWDTASMGSNYGGDDGSLTVYGRKEFNIVDDTVVWTVEFISGDGGSFAPSTYPTIQSIVDGDSVLNVPVINAYSDKTHTGWKVEESATGNVIETIGVNDVTTYIIEANLILSATYEDKSYDITFKVGDHGTWDGADVADKTVPTEHGETPLAPTVVKNTGWRFTGWSPSIVAATGEATYTAQYEKETYDITFKVGDHGTWDGTDVADKTVPTEHGETPLAPTPIVDAGWTFDGWNPTIVPAAGEATYTAEYTQIDYDIEFIVGANGTTTDTVLFEDMHYGDAFPNIPSVVGINGYSFTGWDPSLSTPPSTVTGSAIYTAQYTQDKYTVTFAAGTNGSLTGTLVYSDLAYNSDFPSVPTVTADNGYTFSGWSPVLPTKVTGTKVYTAQYAQDEYTITFDAGTNGALSGTTMFTGLHYNDAFPIAPIVTPDNAHVFTGWSPSLPSKVTYTGVFTAQYAPIEYRVTFVDFDGTLLGTSYVLPGQTAVAPVQPTRGKVTRLLDGIRG